jgi:hypothetical protein
MQAQQQAGRGAREGSLARVISLIAALALILSATAFASVAQANLQFDQVGFGVDDAPDPDNLNPDGTFVQPPFNRQAGAHPDLTVAFSVTGDPGTGRPAEAIRDDDVDLPLGFVGNPTAIPTCAPNDLANPGVGFSRCPTASQIGVAELYLNNGSELNLSVPVFNIAHGPNVPARFGFESFNVIGVITARVRPGDYGVSSGSFSITQAMSVRAVRLHIWGVPADPIHDRMRTPGETKIFAGSGVNRPSPPGGGATTDSPRAPFLTNPTSCADDPVSFTMRGDSWEHPGAYDTHTVAADEAGVPFKFDGCNRLAFDPTIDAVPGSHAAGVPTGLGVDIKVPQPQDPDGLATAHVKKVVTRLPAGMAVSSSSAAGLGSCTPPQIGLGTNDAPTCPDSSKLGSVTIKTPLLAEELEGSVYLAAQNDNPFNSFLAMYIAVRGPGFYLKLAGKVEPDPSTGQLTVTFDNTPQLPFSNLHLQLKDGPRAALSTPSACGTYTTRTEFTSWAQPNKPVVSDSSFTINENCGVSSQFAPGLSAGTSNPTGGSYSPFTLQVTQQSGEQNLSRIEATLPKGVLAKLAGVSLCPDVAAATGACPASSQVGTTTVGSGAGPNPLYVPEPGKAPTAVYLAGPYNGAPYSLVVKVPAQAGPFDLGIVTVRNALFVDPTTAQVTAKSDPLPQILQGIPLAYRDVRVEVNRPDFTLNPTSCDPMQVTSTMTSAAGATAHPSTPFQAAGCGELGFKPALSLALNGATKRTGNPALTAVLTAPKGQANIAKTTVLLPSTEFIDNAHINNPCTRVQFNANACPAGSILGTATAYTPLLDRPLSGPVYFRSNGGERNLPDIVADLGGQIHVTLVGFIDSVRVKGTESARVRTRFQNVPDAPVSKFVLKLKGGKKGLIENSVDLCKGAGKATVQMTGQNGKPNNFDAAIGTSCGKSKKSKRAAGR